VRKTFVETLVQLAAQDERIFLLTGDLGYMALEPFANAYPKRLINVGVAEQNMVGIATGLAESGFVPFVYSIATFATLRPYEFIRNGPIAHGLPVRIVGVGGGFEYSHNGLSHFALEDIAVMRTQPSLRVVAPADAAQARTALEKTWNLDGPIYYRLGKDERPRVEGLHGRFDVDRVQTTLDGQDCLILSVGSISFEARQAASTLSATGVSCAHAVVSSINPPPSDDLALLLSRHRAVVSVEAHYARGGLFSLLCETVGELGQTCKIHRCAVENIPDGITGDLQFMYEKNGLSPAAIVAKARAAVQEARSACLTL